MQRQAEAARKRELREEVRQQREHDRQQIRLQKEQHVRYLADRESGADDSNRELREQIESHFGWRNHFSQFDLLPH